MKQSLGAKDDDQPEDHVMAAADMFAFQSMFALEGKVAVITGNSKGLGLAAASGMLQAGASTPPGRPAHVTRDVRFRTTCPRSGLRPLQLSCQRTRRLLVGYIIWSMS